MVIVPFSGPSAKRFNLTDRSGGGSATHGRVTGETRPAAAFAVQKDAVKLNRFMISARCVPGLWPLGIKPAATAARQGASLRARRECPEATVRPLPCCRPRVCQELWRGTSEQPNFASRCILIASVEQAGNRGPAPRCAAARRPGPESPSLDASGAQEFSPFAGRLSGVRAGRPWPRLDQEGHLRVCREP